MKGICAEGGITADLSWTDGKMQKATLLASAEAPCRIALPEGSVAEFSLNGTPLKTKTDADGRVSLKVKPADRIEISFKNK